MNTIPEVLSAGKPSKYNPVPEIPDIVTATQFAAMNAPADLRPERRLKAAVLIDAIGIVRGGRVTDRHQGPVLQETTDWFASDAPGRGFSFSDICGELGLELAYVRKQVAQIDENLPTIALPGCSGTGRMIIGQNPTA